MLFWHSKVFRRAVLSLLLGIGFFGTQVLPLHAQQSLSVTVTPPLFQLTIGPGESWTSMVKIVNNNAFDVTYYAQVMGMQAAGEEGRSKFIPQVDEVKDPAQQATALSRWIHLSPDPIFVRAGGSQDVPFTVEIPPNAEPGGHYAAILVGTEPGGLHATGTLLKVSSFVSSLFFARIKGDVVESGRIREFLSSQELYQTPKADFLLRFENTGNTHVRPQGDITILNMWGKERGKVLINQDADSNFGNVLPKSIRRFQFSWEGNNDPFDIGLYSAVVTLAYGENGKQNVTGKTYFWVVPVVPVAIGLLSLVVFLLSLVWFIRRYIRRAIELEQKRYGINPSKPMPSASIVGTLMEPVRVGVIDLRRATSAKPIAPEPVRPREMAAQEVQPHSAGQFIHKYKLFLLFVIIVVLGCLGGWLYFKKVLTGKRGFQITDVHIQAENAPKTDSLPLQRP